jgi:hypothetical protein
MAITERRTSRLTSWQIEPRESGDANRGWRVPNRVRALRPRFVATRPTSAQMRLALLGLLLACLLLGALAPDGTQATRSQTQQAKAALDREIAHARTAAGIPDALLQPVLAQEAQAAAGTGSIFYNYQSAAAAYTQLRQQVLGIEQTALSTLQQQALADMQSFANLLNERRGEGFSEIAAYQARFDTAQQAFVAAKTPADFAQVSTLATTQIQALQALWPAYQKLQTLQAIIKSVHDAGSNTQVAQRFYDQDLAIFHDASTPVNRYQELTSAIDAQIMQIQASAASVQPRILTILLEEFQARIDLLNLYGDAKDAAAFQQQHDADAQQLAANHNFSDLLSLSQTVSKQNDALSSPLIRYKSRYDYKQLDTLVHQPSVAKRMMVNKSGYDGWRSYPIAYEYLDQSNGIGDAADMLSRARTDVDYQSADFRITSLEANLRAMLDNYDAATDEVDERDDNARINPVHERPHASDLQLMQYYGVMSGKVIVISLREQTARFYDNGQMQAFTYVTTGRPGETSIPGFWTAINHHAPNNPNRKSPTPVPPGFGDLFTAPSPKGTPGYYDPTPIHYDVAYHEFGYWLHDAYWRRNFGPETDLAHRDPNAFNGGSHGCVNLPYHTPVINGRTVGVNMEWVYNWTPIGTPIIIY